VLCSAGKPSTLLAINKLVTQAEAELPKEPAVPEDDEDDE
jgi:hypothetical protein